MPLRRFHSRRQLLDCLDHGLVEVIHSSPVHPPAKGCTDVGAGQPELNIVHLVGHRVLCTLANNRLPQTGRTPTLIVVRITLTEPKAALAGVMPNESFARLTPSIAAFKEERVVSRRFGRWGLVAMVKTRGSCEKTVWHEEGRES